MTHSPDKWLIVKTNEFNKVFAVWGGGYLDGSFWRCSSVIENVTEEDNYFLFHCKSGSTYRCNKNNYGTSSFGSSVLSKVSDKLEVLKDPTEYIEVMKTKHKTNVKGDSRPSENQGFSEGADTPENPNEVGVGKSSGLPTCSPKYYYLQLSDQSGTVVEETRYMAWDRRGNERLDVLNKAIERTIHPAQQNGYSADDLKFKISRFPSSGGRFDVSSTNLNGEDPSSPDSGN